MHYIILIIIMFATMMIYFKIAHHYNIIDKPNERSSHTEVTIRGGGVVFLISAVIAAIVCSEYGVVVGGIVAIGLISFIDDRITLSNKVRLLVHLISVSLLFISLQLFSQTQWYTIAFLYVIVTGIVNAYNFMDGINGMTGAYSLILLSGLQYLNYRNAHFVSPDMIWLPIIACSVFLFFNFRKKASCFAGDVGSITIAFWIVFLLLKLILVTGNIGYILFLLVYGLDSVTTILFRLLRKENIFEAHRSHFYQYLANEKKISHLIISAGYAIVQLIIIVAIIMFPIIHIGNIILIIFFFAFVFIAIRFFLEGKAHLLGH